MRGSLKTWLILGLLLSTLGYALAEDLTLTTYYPSPRGVYKELIATLLKAVTLEVDNLTLNPPGNLTVPGTFTAQGDASFGTLGNNNQFSMAGALTILARTGQTTPLAVFKNSIGVEVGAIAPNGGFGIGTNKTSDTGGLTETVARIKGQPAGVVMDSGSTPSPAVAGLILDETAGLKLGIRTGPAQNLIFLTSDAERMRIDGTGNVGIGTTSPATTLDVAGLIKPGIYDSDSAAGASAPVGSLYYVENGSRQSLKVKKAAGWKPVGLDCYTGTAPNNGSNDDKFTVTCQPGYVAVGGGFEFHFDTNADTKPHLWSRPGSETDFQDTRRWFCRVTNEPTGNDGRCWARCCR